MRRRANVHTVDGSANVERISELAQPERLRGELERAFASLQSRGVVVGLRCGERSACVDLHQSAGPLRAPIRVGCLAKLFTAMLARRAFEEGRLAPDEQASDLFMAGAARRALRGITVRHLLEHTHGLDDSLLYAVPRDSRGQVDAEALAHALCAAAPLGMPGALYSYGNAGAWVIAAVLERLAGRPYAAQLVETLLEPLRLDARDSAASVCPATGGELALNAADLLNLVADAAFAAPDVWPDEQSAGDYGFATPLPGWNPLERGIYLGWKYHGAGWLGHQSVWPGHSVLVRAHPRRRLALIAAATEHPAAVVAARVFGAYLPELFELKIPARAAAILGRPTGSFRSAAWRVDIEDVDDELELRARRADNSEECSAVLRAVCRVFGLRGRCCLVFPHVEAVELIVRTSGTDGSCCRVRRAQRRRDPQREMRRYALKPSIRPIAPSRGSSKKCQRQLRDRRPQDGLQIVVELRNPPADSAAILVPERADQSVVGMPDVDHRGARSDVCPVRSRKSKFEGLPLLARRYPRDFVAECGQNEIPQVRHQRVRPTATQACAAKRKPTHCPAATPVLPRKPPRSSAQPSPNASGMSSRSGPPADCGRRTTLR